MNGLSNKSPSFRLSFLAAACLLANVSSYGGRANSYAGRKSSETNPHSERLWQQLTPRVLLDGTLASQGFLYGEGMVPVVGSAEGFAFLDGVGKGGTDKGWLGGLGGGLREIWRGAIFGGYVFGEYDRTALGNNYWMVNPGVEMLLPHWDFRVNGYLPVGRRENVNAVLFGSQLGITCPTFKGHQQFDQVFNDVNAVAPGIDAQVGYIIPKTHRTRVFVGGYYYFFEHAPELHGLVGGIELPLNQRISLLFRDSYDNVNKNTALFTLRAYFGGTVKVDEEDIHERLLDPIERDIGVLYTGSGIPTQQVIYNTGELKLQRDNIWFFKPGANGNSAITPNACTYENPCNSGQFTQLTINTINGFAPLANFYLADGGTYPISAMVVNSGQSIYGRTEDFCKIAPGSPVLLGSLTLEGNNYLQAFRLVNQTPPSLVGITAINAPNITLDQVKVGPDLTMAAFAPIPAGSFRTGVNLNNAQNVLITNSVINAGIVSEGPTPFTNGIIAENHSTVTVKNSTVNAHLSVVANQVVTTTRTLAAIYLHNQDKASLYSNTINMVGDGITSLNVSPALTLQSAGISIVNDNQAGVAGLIANTNRISVTNGVNQRNPNGQGRFNNTRGLSIYNASGTVQVDMTNNEFIVKNTALGAGTAYDYFTAGVFAQADNQSHTAINSNNNKFFTYSTLTSTNGNGRAENFRGIDFRVVGGISPTLALNSKNDVFIHTINIDAGLNAFSIGHNEIRAQADVERGFGSNITINTQGDRFTLNSTTFARNGNAIDVDRLNAGIYLYSGGAQAGQVITVNSTSDTFNINSSLNAPNGLASSGTDWGIYNYAGSVGSRLTVNANGDAFNIRVNAKGAILSPTNIYGAAANNPGAVVNLINGNVFRFFVNNGGSMIIPKQTFGGATIFDDGTNRFLIY